MNLQDEIADLQLFFSQTPRDEAATRERIIYPLLRAAGYSTREIQSEQNDNFNKRPDYTLLPDEPEATWFLEAKAWRVELDDEQVFQALNYANHNGKRWVVLSNGRSWRLYDNDVRGLPSAKLAVEATLSDVHEIESLLHALRPASIRSEEIATFVDAQRRLRQEQLVRSRVAEELAKASMNPDSPLVAAMVDQLALTISDVKSEIVSEALRHMGGSPAQPKPFPLTGGPQPPSLTPPTKSWTPYQAAMRLFVENMIRNTPGLAVEHSWKRGVGFMPQTWDQSVARGGEWGQNGRILLFWFDVDNESPSLLLKLIIGPGPTQERERLFRIAQSNAQLGPTRKNPSQKWDTVFRREFQVGVHGSADLATVQAGLQAEWEQFVTANLPDIERAFC